MDKLGIVIHVSKNNKLILRTKIKVKIGVRVLNEELKSVGKILDVFGPKKKPYVSIEPSINEAEQFVGKPLYIIMEKRKGKN